MFTIFTLISRAALATAIASSCLLLLMAGASGLAPYSARAAEEPKEKDKEKENLTPAQQEARARMKAQMDVAKKASEAGDFATAEREYNAVETSFPDQLSASFFLSRAGTRLELLKYKEADDDFTKVLILSELQKKPVSDRTKATIWLWQCVARQQMGWYDESIECVRKALALPALTGSQKARGGTLLGISLYCKGDMEGAIEAWKPLREMTGKEYAGYSVAGCNYIWVANARLGRETEATRELEAILKKKLTEEESSWQCAAGVYLLGKMPAKTLLGATLASTDEDMKVRTVCQGHFFIAAKLMSTDKAEARKHLVQCLESKVMSVVPEKVMAAADLKRLDAAEAAIQK